MKLQIKVTQDHIDKGFPCRSGSCPIALACNEFPDYAFPMVFPRKMYLFSRKNAKNLSVTLPLETQNFIHKFDSLEPVSPFEFEVDIPDTP